MLWRAGQVLLTLFNIAFAIMALYFIFKGGVSTSESPGLEWKDFVTILLTALAVMIALSAIFVAGAAVWTYKEAMEIVRVTADKAAREVAGPIAARTARETLPSETDAAQAAAIAAAVEEPPNV
jgi:hypothetical protein